MRSGFHDLPFVHGDDAVRHAYGGQAVGDDEYGAVAADGLHVLHNGAFGFVVERAGGFVENQDARVADQGAGDGDALALAAGQAGALFADFGVVAFGKFHNKVVGAGELGSPRRSDS